MTPQILLDFWTSIKRQIKDEQLLGVFFILIQ